MAIDHVWTGGGFSDFWSDAANWGGAAIPPTGGSSTLSIRFATSRGGVRSSVDNLPGALTLNLLEFDQGADSSLSLSTSAGSLIIGGVNSRILQEDSGAITLTGLTLNPADGVTTLAGVGSGHVTLNAIRGSAGQTLRIATPSASPSGQLITLAGTGQMAGTVELVSGNLVIGPQALGSATLSIKGGTVRVSATGTCSNPIVVSSPLVLVNTMNSTFSGAISGSGGIELRGLAAPSTGQATDQIRITAPATYTGSTVIDYGLNTSTPHTDAGIIRLSGNGSILNTSEFQIRAGGTLAVETLASGTTNRIGDSTPIKVSGGRLQVESLLSGTTTQSERVGPISFEGASMIAATTTSGARVDLTVDSLTRLDRGTIVFRTLLGNTTRIFLATPPTLTGGGGTGVDTSIIPYAIGDPLPPNGAGLVTYDPVVGVRLLASTEYVSSFAAATPTSNVRLSTLPQTVATDTTINSLFLSIGNLTGTGIVRIASGMVLVGDLPTFPSSGFSVPLDFGTAEGHIITISNLIAAGTIAGSNGLTKSGAGTLNLQRTNSFTGPLTINQGTVQIGGTAGFGGLGTDTSAIRFVAGSGVLQWSSASFGTLTRPIDSVSGFAGFATTSAGLEIAGGISGAGGVRIVTGNVRLSGTNTYQGETVISAGTLEIANDSALGTGELVIRSTLRLLGDWTTTRGVRFSSGTINTNGFNATFNGEILGTAGFTKIGLGRVTLTKPSSFSGAIMINGDTIELSGDGSVQASNVFIGAGAELLLDHSDRSEGRLSSNTALTLTSGTVRLASSGGGPSRETFRTVSLTANSVGNRLLLERSGTGSVTVSADSFSAAASEILIRADALGGPASAAFSRFLFTTPPAATDGLTLGMYAAPLSGTNGESFTKYDQGTDSAGIVGVRPLAAAEYASGPVQDNSGTLNYLIQPGTVAAGTTNTVRSLTFGAGGTLTQTAGQTLLVGSNQILARSGAPSSLSGGRLEFASASGSVVAYGDLTLDAPVMGVPWRKLGPGTLILGAQPADAAPLTIVSGALRPLSTSALAASTITMGGGSATIDMAGTTATIGALTGTGVVRLGGGALTIGALGQDFTFNGTFPDPGEVIIVDGGNPSVLRRIGLTSTPGGGTIRLVSGELIYGDANTSNPQPLILAGGILSIPNGQVVRAPLQLSGDAYIAADTSKIGSPSVITGQGNLHLVTFHDLTLEAAANHSGETIVEYSSLLSLGSNSVASGSLAQTSAIRVLGGHLTVQYGQSSAERLNDTAPIHLIRGGLSFTGRSDQTVTEQTGRIVAYPGASLSVAPNHVSSTSSILELRPTALERAAGGTLFIGTSDLNASGPFRAAIQLSSLPALIGGGETVGPNTSIIPWVVTNRPFGATFMTANTSGTLRALDITTDFVQGLAAVSQPTNNLMVTGTQVLDQSLTVNSLLLSGTSGAAITGNGTLTITSGAMLCDASGNIPDISAGLVFGEPNAMIYAQSSQPLTISGPVATANGLTIDGDVKLTGVNSLVGPLRVVNGSLAYTRRESLGSTSAILLDNSAIGYLGNGASTLSIPIEIGPSGATLGNDSQTGSFEISGTISGTGLVRAGGYDMLLSGTSTFTGGLYVNGSGVLRFTSDAALGTGDIVGFGGGTLEPTFDWIATRSIWPGSNARFSTGPFQVQWNGPVLGRGTLTKQGTGSLTIRDADEYYGDIQLNAGTLRIEGRLGNDHSGFGDDVIASQGTILEGFGDWDRVVNASGILSPGPNIASLEMDALYVGQTSTIQLEIAGPASFDKLIITGPFGFAKANLDLRLSYDPADFVDSFLLLLPGRLQVTVEQVRSFFGTAVRISRKGRFFRWVYSRFESAIKRAMEMTSLSLPYRNRRLPPWSR